MAHTIYSAHRDGDRDATLAESLKWRKAAADKRIKTKKLRGKDAVKVWIEPILKPQDNTHSPGI
jgi:hypothetical protein